MKIIIRFLFVVVSIFTLTRSSLAQWVQTNGPGGGTVNCFAVSGTNLFAGTDGGGVFLSTDNGTNWTAVNNGLPDNTSVYAFAVSGTNLFAGTSGGVFLSTDNGTSWTPVNNGLTYPYPHVYALAASGTNLFAGTYHGGVWRRPLSEMITAVDDIPGNELLRNFSLEQNYPNPFNPTTTISFILPSKSFVSLKVFDALGRQVASLVNEELPAGRYTQQWDAAGLPSGMYYYRLQTGSYAETKKLVLLR